ncbi:hypothetical protein [Streptacidiphilus anmyonensis]|uniref:hypothetical protein n=1 Tax=Streptacidiphilus anmyonensis TaxID=405782 RepID=UPI0005A6D074|nr:hypothetical protein [Streptacidiphilus anmyonensis]
MDGGFGVAGATLAGRLGRLRRYRWWLARLVAALPAVALLAYGMSAPPTAEGASSPESVFWQDDALPFLLLAATLTLWRAPEEGLPDALRLRDLHRRVCRRAAVVLLFGACLALGVDHWYSWHPDPAAASAAAGTGLALFWLALVPVLLEPALWPLWPAPIRRAVRAARTAEALYRPAPRQRLGGGQSVSYPAPGAITDFDADPGASGRPRPFLHQAAGPRSSGRATAPSRARQRRQGSYLHWDGTKLIFDDGKGGPRAVALADARHAEGVAELVWVTPRDLLFFVDRDGYRVGRPVSGLQVLPGSVGQVAAAAGLAFNAYELSSHAGTRGEQAGLLFPRRPRLVRAFRRRLARR